MSETDAPTPDDSTQDSDAGATVDDIVEVVGTDDDAEATDVEPADVAEGDNAEAVAPLDEVEEEAEPEPEPELLDGVPVTWSRGQAVLHPSIDDYLPLVKRLRDEGYWTAVDLCGIDYLAFDAARDLPPGTVAERFEVAVVLRNHGTHDIRRIRVQVPAENPTIASLFGVHPGVQNAEREAFDMFGITFDGNPDLSRILMPDDWDGHPLRKDYAVGRIPVQFKGVSSAR